MAREGEDLSAPGCHPHLHRSLRWGRSQGGGRGIAGRETHGIASLGEAVCPGSCRVPTNALKSQVEGGYVRPAPFDGLPTPGVR